VVVEEAAEIRDLGVDDVDSLISCISACYGDSYPEPDFYDASFLRAELASRQLLCVGAVVDGRVIGNIGTKMPAAGNVAEMVAGMVHPAHRGRGLTVAIGARMVARLRDEQIGGVRQFATGAHDRTQRLIVASGGVPTGVLIGHVPAQTDYREIEHQFGGARIGVVVYFQTFGALDPLDVYVPGRYEYAAAIYDELNMRRRLLRPGDIGDRMEGWPCSFDHDDRVGMTRLGFGALAGPSRRPISVVLDLVRRSDAPLTYADIPLADPRSERLVELLHDEGFVFGALLPGTAATEALRLQRIAARLVAPSAIVVASESGRQLLDRIRVEHAQAA
jgi:hypothetical protein